MKKLSKLLLAISFAVSMATSAFAVTVVSWGGAYTESQKLGYGDPTAKALGIDINWVDYSGGLSEIKAQKEAGKITWDIIDVFAMDTITGCDEGLFVEFDFDKDFPPAPDGTPASEDFFTSMPSKCAVGNILYSWNYAYNSKNVKGTPKTIKDFFNTKKFPGKRAIYKGALTNLEIALAADGIKPGKGGAFNQVELKSVIKGTKLNERFRSSETVEKAEVDEKKFNFLYIDGENCHFMDNKTFEQVEIQKSITGEQYKLLKEDLEVTISFMEGKPISIELPNNIECLIETTDAAIKNQTASSSYKPAMLDCGIKINVPPFIESGEKIIIDTRTLEYVKRVN